MKKIRSLVLAATLAGGVAVVAAPQASAASCTGTITSSTVRGYCPTSLAGTHFNIRATCTDGSLRQSGWIRQGYNGYVTCNGARVSTFSFWHN